MAGERPGKRRLTVERRIVESDEVVSLHLVPADGGALPEFLPGQYLTFRVPGPDGAPVTRNYSISSDPADRSHLRISVKREPHGCGSGFMHDRMPEGATIEANGPTGDFVLDRSSGRAVVLLAGGIGITPLLAMAHALAADARRPAYLFHACRDAAVRPFRAELAALTKRAPALKVFTVLEQAGAVGSDDPHFAGEGRITRALLQAKLPLDAYDAYLCGPKPFMQAMYEVLLSLGLPEARIAYEFFGPAVKLGAPSQEAAAIAAPATTRPERATTGGMRVTFADSGITAEWDGTHRTLIELAEAQGLSPAFSCRSGICGTCVTEVEGRVRYVEDPLDDPGPGKALICCSVPDGPVTLKL